MEEYTVDHPNVEILDKNVIVFHNTLKDPDAYIDYYEEYGNWRGWYGFGRQIDARTHYFKDEETFPEWSRWEEKRKDFTKEQGEDPYRDEIAAVWYSATKFFMEHTGTVLPNWNCQPWGLARYIPDEDLINNDTLTMNYHTDYMPNDAESQGDKFGITGVLYPNDDYEGGEICFKIAREDGTVARFEYKPKAGDLVMFPSGPPYYHGVKRVYGSPKYITRLYWMYYYEGSEDWHSLKEKYGEKFEELESARKRRGDLMIMEPFMKSRFTVKEYYDLLESGELLDFYEQERPE